MEFDDIRDFGLDLQNQIKEMSNIQQNHFADVTDMAVKLTKQSKVLFNIDKGRASLNMGLADIVKDQLQNLKDGNTLELKKFSVTKAMKLLGDDMNENQQKAMTIQLQMLQDMIDSKTLVNDKGKTQIDILNEENDILEEQREKLMNIGKRVDGFTKTLTTMAKNPKVAGGVFMASLAKSGGELAQSMLDTRVEMGLSGSDSMILAKNMSIASVKGLAFGVGLGKAGESASALYDEFKDINDVTDEAIVQVGKMSTYYGLAVNDGAKLYKMFSDIQPLTNQSAEDSFKIYENIAKAGGVSTGKTMGEVAQNTEYFAKYSKAGTNNIINAAVSAQQLGLSLGTIDQISSSLLDIDSSIEAEMSASVLTGKQLNFNKARELALARDHAGMMKEILNNQFTISEWNEWDVIQRQKVAESLGMSTDQMQTMISQQEKLGKIHDVYGSALGDNVIKVQGMVKGAWEQKELLMSSVMALSSMKSLMPGIFKGMGKMVRGVGQWISGLLKGKAIQSATETGGTSSKLLSSASKGKDLSKTTGAIGKDGISKMKGNPIVNWINGWKKLDLKALAKFSLAIGVIIVTIPLLAIALKQFADVPFESALMGMGSMLAMAGIMKVISKMGGGILKGSIALAIMSASLIPLGYALQQFTDIDWKTLGIAGTALVGLTLAMFGLGALLTGPGAILFGAGVLGFLALGGALSMLGLGLQMIVNPITAFIPLIMQLSSISGSLSSIGEGFALMGVGILSFAGSLLAITPMIPILATLTTLTTKLKPIMTGGSGKSDESKDSKMDKLISSVDNLVSTLNKGGGVYINDREVGRYLGLKMNKMKVNGI